MAPTFYLIACGLVLGQPAPADTSDWQVQPRLGRGQELVYRGTYAEEASGPGVQFQRQLRLENRIFVLDVGQHGTEIAVLTLWRGRPGGVDGKADLETNSVRLECGRLSSNGLKRDVGRTSWAVPLDGPPTVECGAFVEVPFGRVVKEQFWETSDEGRPPLGWRVLGLEAVNGSRCVKLQGEQQSDDWERPRAERTAWRRVDTVWLVPQAGYAAKVERTIETRDPSRREPSQKLVLKYELESSLQYPGKLFEDRRREIQQIHGLRTHVLGLLPRAGELGPRPFEALLTRIKNQVEQQAPTPYREALRNVQRLAEAGRRGEVPPEVQPAEAGPVAQVISLGKTAPDFLTTDLADRQSTRLRKWLGRPILLVFYTPDSPLGTEVLRFAQRVSDAHAETATVLGLAVSENADKALKQRDAMKLTFPLLSGTGLRLSYAVEATPKVVVLDAAGVVQGSYLGWGPEMPRSILEDLQRCVTPGR